MSGAGGPGERQANELGPLARGRLLDLEERRDLLARSLHRLLDPESRFGRWSPHYLPHLQDLMKVELQIDGFCYGNDLDATSLASLTSKEKP